MLDLEKIKSSGFFTLEEVKAGKVFLREGDIDEHLYIIYDGELIVEKSINTLENSFKILSHLGVGNIFGEASLSSISPKEVQIRAKRDTWLLKIHGQKDFPKFVSQFPNLGYGVLIGIIQLSNSRLLKSNREITANYEVNIAISKIKDFSVNSIYKLLLVFESILEVDQVMYFEKNLVVEHYYKLKYNSLDKKSLQNRILKLPNEILDTKILESEDIRLAKFLRSAPLKLGETHYGFLVVGHNKKDFSENEEKLLINVVSSLVGVIHQKKLIDDQKNKNYIKSI